MRLKFLPVVIFLFLFQNCTAQPSKINGVSFVASRKEVIQDNVDPLIALHTNYAAVMPFGFMRSKDSTSIIHNTSRQWFGEKRAGAKQYIDLLHKTTSR